MRSPSDGASRRRLAGAIAGLAGAIAAGTLHPQQAGAQAVPRPLPAIPNPVPQGSPIPRIAPPAAPSVGPGLTGPSQEPLQNLAPSTPRRVTAVSVEGSTILTAAETDAITAGLVGPATPISAIEAARLELLRRYRGAGYPLVTVAAALGTDGRVHFTVTEGRIAEVQLDGDIGPAGTKVLGFLNNLVQPGPVKASQLERWLLLAQDVPGVSLQTVLRPSENEPGALVLIARVTRAPFSGFFAADNRAYQYTGPTEALAVIGTNSLSSLGERIELSLFTSPFDSTQIFGQASYESFIGNSGLKIRLYGGAGDTRPTGQLRTVGYDSRAIVAGVQLSYPLIYSRQQKLNLVGNFDLIQSDIYTNANGTSEVTSKDSLRVIRLGGDYALQDLLFGPSRPAVNTVVMRVSQGIEGLGSSHTGSTTLAPLGANVSFTKFTAELTRTQILFSPWQDATVGLLTLLAGQATGDILPSVEKFYLGGLRFNRGFYSGQVTGDNALAATAELQLNTSYQGTVLGTPLDIGLQFYTFYDWGESWDNGKLGLTHTLRSFGLGLRASLTRSIEVDVEGVSRLTRTPLGSAAVVKPLDAQAVYWRILTRF